MTEVRAVERTEPALLPKGTTLGDLFALQDALKKEGDRINRLDLNKLKGLKGDIETLMTDEVRALEKVLEAKKNQSNWSYQTLIATALWSGISIIGGAYLNAIGQNSGKIFIASGIAAFATSLLQHHQIDEASLLPLGIYLLSFATNTICAYRIPSETQNLITLAERIISYLQVALGVGAAVATFKQNQAELHLLKIQQEMNLANKKVDSLSGRLEMTMEQFRSTVGILKTTFKKFIQATSEIAIN